MTTRLQPVSQHFTNGWSVSPNPCSGCSHQAKFIQYLASGLTDMNLRNQVGRFE